MNITDTRAITSVTVSRTSSLREPSRPTMKEDQAPGENGSFSLNKRSLSNDKMSSDSMAPVFISQRGSSLRQNGKSAFPMSSPNLSNRHPFKIIETSPRSSESNIDTDMMSSLKMSSKVSLKFKHRPQVPSSGGPLIPDHSLMKEPTRGDNVHFTPRPPLVKKFSSDQDDPSSDIDCGLSIKSTRCTAPRPPISPTRGVGQVSKSTVESSTEKKEKLVDISDEDTSELEDNHNSDCETPPSCNGPTETVVSAKHRSSLRKGSDSPNHSDVPGRGSPSPTKTVKWNMNTEVKKIPRSRSLNGKIKSTKSRSQRSAADRNTKLLPPDQRLVECHESYISHCTSLIRHQVSLLENLRHDRISVSQYKKDLIDFLDHQKKLVANLQSIMSDVPADPDKSVTLAS